MSTLQEVEIPGIWAPVLGALCGHCPGVGPVVGAPGSAHLGCLPTLHSWGVQRCGWTVLPCGLAGAGVPGRWGAVQSSFCRWCWDQRHPGPPAAGSRDPPIRDPHPLPPPAGAGKLPAPPSSRPPLPAPLWSPAGGQTGGGGAGTEGVGCWGSRPGAGSWLGPVSPCRAPGAHAAFLSGGFWPCWRV